jgi:hypothetical protein
LIADERIELVDLIAYSTTRSRKLPLAASWSVVIKLAEDPDDSFAPDLILSQEHLNVLFEFVLRVRL